MIKSIKRFRVSSSSITAFLGIALALLLRLSLRDFQGGDFSAFARWYEVVRTHGFGVMRTAFHDSSPPYLYLLFLISRVLPHLSTVLAVKLPSMIADFVCAWYVYRIVRLKYELGPVPVFAALVVLFAPTVVINSAVWGQVDMLFTAP